MALKALDWDLVVDLEDVEGPCDRIQVVGLWVRARAVVGLVQVDGMVGGSRVLPVVDGESLAQVGAGECHYRHGQD